MQTVFMQSNRPICRPQEMQRVVHATKFQSVVTRNGIIANFYGPVEGCRDGSVMLTYSSLLQQLEQHFCNL